MLISSPFLTETAEDGRTGIRHAMHGRYPINNWLEWHNGRHLIAPTENGQFLPVRAIADATVVHLVPPGPGPDTNPSHPQNYNAFSGGPEWTDKGLLILRHETEIGANGNTPVTLTYYSVYMHLSHIEAALSIGTRVYRKDILGQAGQIYGRRGCLHFEICLDDDNLERLLGHTPDDHPDASAIPTAHGRTNAVWGNTYIYLPASTPVIHATAEPGPSTPDSGTLGTPLWVEIRYAGDAKLTSYYAEGDSVGEPIDDPGTIDPATFIEADGEYQLYDRAKSCHQALDAATRAQSSPSGWYELLRFGRVLGPDPLPDDARHWRRIAAPHGQTCWADLNAPGTFKFSDADFPAFLGWQCIHDDPAPDDQRCDSTALRTLLARSIPDMEARAHALEKTPEGYRALARQIEDAKVRSRLRRLICNFPSEFDFNTFDARYAHVKDEEDFKDDPDNWKRFRDHAEALCPNDLPKAYLDARWHVHPTVFIEHMRKCSWLSHRELAQCLPSHAIRTHRYRDAQRALQTRMLWERVPINPLNRSSSFLPDHYVAFNRSLRKYGINTPLRLASVLGNAWQETLWLGGLAEFGGTNTWYAPWYGRGFLQLTGPGNYIEYWRFRGRTVPETLKQALQTAMNNAHPQRGNNRAGLQDHNFPALTQEMIRWREQVRGVNPAEAESLLAPSDSAGFYAVMSRLPRYADAPHDLERHEVANTVNPQGVAQGNHVYYRSRAFWRVSASINLPSAINNVNYAGINGFDSRCSAYGVALAVLSERRFPDAQGRLTLEYPEGYRRERTWL